MKIPLSLILDAAFYLVAGFFLWFIPVNYALPRPASYVLAATLAVIFTIFAVNFSAGKKTAKFISAKTERKYNAVMTKLNLSEDKFVSDLFEKALKADGLKAEKKRGCVHLPDEKKTVFFRFGFDGVNKTELVKCFNKTDKNCKTEIYSETFSDEIKEFAARFNGKMVLTDGKEAFALLEKHGLLPKDAAIIEEKQKAAFDFSRLLDKKRAKNYLVFGLFFVFLSYFVPIKGYYLVFGAVFLTLALILRLFGKTAV